MGLFSFFLTSCLKKTAAKPKEEREACRQLHQITPQARAEREIHSFLRALEKIKPDPEEGQARGGQAHEQKFSGRACLLDLQENQEGRIRGFKKLSVLF